MERSKDAPILMDHFLFDCYERENEIKAQEIKCYDDDSGKFANFTEGLDHHIRLFKNKYFENIKEEEIDASNISKHTEFVVDLVTGARILLQKCYSIELPDYPTQDDVPMPDLWKDVIRALDENFKELFPYLMTYFTWCYKKQVKEEAPRQQYQDDPAENFGNTDQYRGSSTHQSRGSSRNYRGDSSQHRGSSRQHRSDSSGQSRQTGQYRTDSKRKGSSHRSTSRSRSFQDRGERGGYGDKRGRSRRPRDRDGESGSSRISNRKKEEMAILEAKKKIDILKKSDDMTHIQLSPVNSYLRRLQHQFIMDLGFFSRSEGEDKERAIVIYKDSNE